MYRSSCIRTGLTYQFQTLCEVFFHKIKCKATIFKQLKINYNENAININAASNGSII
jgi:hypothetical protein